MKFIIIFFIGIVFSAALYFIPLYSFKLISNNNLGYGSTLWDPSLSSYASIAIIGTLIILEDMSFHSVFSICILALHILFNILPYVILDALKSGYMIGGIMIDTAKCPLFWLVMLCTCGITLLPFYLFRRLEFFFNNTIINNVNLNRYKQDYQIKQTKIKLEELSKFNRSIAKFKRVYNQNNFEAQNYADRKMKEIVENYKLNKKTRLFNRD